MPMDIGEGIKSAGQSISRAFIFNRQQEDRNNRSGMARLAALQGRVSPNIYTGDVLPTGSSVPTRSGGASALLPRAQTVSNPGGDQEAPYDPSGVDAQFNPGSFDVNAAMQARRQIDQRQSSTSGAMGRAKKMFARVFKNMAAAPGLERDLKFAVEEAKNLNAMLDQKKARAQFDPSVKAPTDAEIRMMQEKMNKVFEFKERLKQGRGETQELYGELITKYGIDPSQMDEYSLSGMGIKMDPELLQELGIANPGVPGEGQARVFPAFGQERGLGQFQDVGQPAAPAAPAGAAALPQRPQGAPPFLMRR